METVSRPWTHETLLCSSALPLTSLSCLHRLLISKRKLLAEPRPLTATTLKFLTMVCNDGSPLPSQTIETSPEIMTTAILGVAQVPIVSSQPSTPLQTMATLVTEGTTAATLAFDPSIGARDNLQQSRSKYLTQTSMTEVLGLR